MFVPFCVIHLYTVPNLKKFLYIWFFSSLVFHDSVEQQILIYYHNRTYFFSLRVIATVFKEDEKSSGALDLGGASTQITFVPQDTSLATLSFKLYGKVYPVYTKSYLCYGLNEIFRRFLAQLAKVREIINLAWLMVL